MSEFDAWVRDTANSIEDFDQWIMFIDFGEQSLLANQELLVNVLRDRLAKDKGEDVLSATGLKIVVDKEA